jgi:hypothetical protein
MLRFNQYNKFAVNVTKQRIQTGEITTPKAYSVGWVSCFDETAARLLVPLLKEADKNGVFNRRNDFLFSRWKEHGIKEITLKDLRRSSLYYLGHVVGLEFAGLSAHARHAKPETTMLYLRRPVEETKDVELDLDA